MSAELTQNYERALQNLRSLYSPTNLPSVIVTLNNENKGENNNGSTILNNDLGKVNQEHDEEEEDPLKDLEDDWRRVVRMETVSLFKMGLESFIRKYEKRYPEEFFAYAWTNEVKHFGVRTSNRVEGAHSVLKRFLVNSQGGFIECWQQMHNMHASQLVTIKAKFQQSLTIIKHEHNIDDFKGLHHHVSQYALDFLITEIKRLEKSRSVVENLCGCIMYKTHGLPYPSHFLLSILNGGRSIWHHMLHVLMLYLIIFHS
ncbi:hypothetical protein MKW92_045767 [Papaver armeniacum]|nr:hypothetical protein MKW92_045767 [Papaver armeniacum]